MFISSIRFLRIHKKEKMIIKSLPPHLGLVYAPFNYDNTFSFLSLWPQDARWMKATSCWALLISFSCHPFHSVSLRLPRISTNDMMWYWAPQTLRVENLILSKAKISISFESLHRLPRFRGLKTNLCEFKQRREKFSSHGVNEKSFGSSSSVIESLDASLHHKDTWIYGGKKGAQGHIRWKWHEKARNLFVDGLQSPTIKTLSSPFGSERVRLCASSCCLYLF